MTLVRPMQPVTGALPVGPEWTYEVDWAGMRLMADIVEGHLSLLTEDEEDVTARFPEFVGLHEAIADGLLDGEAVMLDGGSPSATALEERLSAGDTHTARGLARRRPAVFMVYDVLRLYGVPLTPRPLDERRAVLGRLDLSAATRIQISPPYEDGPALLSGVREQGLAGVVAKRRTGTYRAGDSGGDWVRVSAVDSGHLARHAHDRRSRRHRGGSDLRLPDFGIPAGAPDRGTPAADIPDIPDLDALAGGVRRLRDDAGPDHAVGAPTGADERGGPAEDADGPATDPGGPATDPGGPATDPVGPAAVPDPDRDPEEARPVEPVEPVEPTSDPRPVQGTLWDAPTPPARPRRGPPRPPGSR